MSSPGARSSRRPAARQVPTSLALRGRVSSTVNVSECFRLKMGEDGDGAAAAAACAPWAEAGLERRTGLLRPLMACFYWLRRVQLVGANLWALQRETFECSRASS